MHCDTLTREGRGDYGDKTGDGGWDSTKGSTRPTNIFRAGYLPLPCRPDTTEPRMAVLMKPDDRLPVQRIRGSNVEQIIEEGKRKSRERESGFLPFHFPASGGVIV